MQYIKFDFLKMEKDIYYLIMSLFIKYAWAVLSDIHLKEVH